MHHLKLGRNKQERMVVYRALFKAHVDGKLIEDIRRAVNKGLALGNESFKDEVEALYGRRVRQARMGRPVKGLICPHLSLILVKFLTQQQSSQQE